MESALLLRAGSRLGSLSSKVGTIPAIRELNYDCIQECGPQGPAGQKNNSERRYFRHAEWPVKDIKV